MVSAPDRRPRSLGEAVRARRVELGGAEVHRTYVSDVERDARNPAVKVSWKLALALETVPGALFLDSEQRMKL
jgi:hypothetical protein